MSITVQGLLVFGFFAVQLSTSEQHCFDAVYVWAMGILSLLALCVVFAVNGGPLFGYLTRGEPQPHAEKMCGQWVQVKRAVGAVAV